MRNGDQARLRPVVIQGIIKETRWNNERECKEHLLTWTDAGEAHERWFLETELEPNEAI